MLLLSKPENHYIAQSYNNCLELLKQREQDLNSMRVQTYWQQQSFDLAEQFLQLQRDLMTVRARLETASLQQIEANLSKFESVLSAECENLVTHIKRLDSPTAFLTTLARISNLLVLLQ